MGYNDSGRGRRRRPPGIGAAGGFSVMSIHALLLILALAALSLFYFFSWEEALGLYVAVLAFLVALLWAVHRFQGKPSPAGTRKMIGDYAVVLRLNGEEAEVRWQGEIWRAVAAEPLHTGQKVVIEGIEGLLLRVRPLESGGTASGPGAE